MKIVIDIPESAYEAYKAWDKNGIATVDETIIANGTPLDSVLDDVWLLYQRYQPYLATNVYKFGVELNELLYRYWKGDNT